MPNFSDKVSFEDVRALKDSGKALLCLIGEEKVWIPHSHIHDDSEVYEEGHEGTLIVSEWIATEKGLI